MIASLYITLHHIIISRCCTPSDCVWLARDEDVTPWCKLADRFDYPHLLPHHLLLQPPRPPPSASVAAPPAAAAATSGAQ